MPRTWLAADSDNAGGFNIDAAEVESTLKHLATGKFLSMLRLLAEDAVIETCSETDSRAKGYHLERLSRFTEQAEIKSFIAGGLNFALDEIFTNTVHNAPAFAKGGIPSRFLSRKADVVSPRPFVIEFGLDERLVAVGVRDAYGSLTVDDILSNLARCYEVGGAVPMRKQGGAGLGFFMLLQNASRLIVNLKTDQFTEVILIRRRGQRRRAFVQSSPTLNLCVVDGEAGICTSRQYSRELVHLAASVAIGPSRSQATVADITRKGAFVRTTAELQEGDKIVLTIARASIDVVATVRWSGKSNIHHCPGYGVEFEEELDQRLLARLTCDDPG